MNLDELERRAAAERAAGSDKTDDEIEAEAHAGEQAQDNRADAEITLASDLVVSVEGQEVILPAGASAAVSQA